ncbi:MAG TPA: TspO/MBR family protein [Acetobacteraceae bacterium]|jgi:tryptophan-rich sensory protein
MAAYLHPAYRAAPAIKGIRVFLQSGPDEWGSYPGSSTPLSAKLALVGFVGLCLLVGAADATLVTGSLRPWYASLIHPPGTPPDWVFGSVWGVLYVMLGVAGWLVWRRAGAGGALRLWGWQLAVNAMWTPAFFGLHKPVLALAVIAVLLALVALTIHRFARVQRLAAALMVPYFAWIGYAAWLNLAFWWLNPA